MNKNRISLVASLILLSYRIKAPRGCDPRCEEPPANTFIPTLPEELRSNPSLQKFKDPGSLAKSYVELERTMGTKRLPVPDATWSEQQWNEFYSQTGRPATHDAYEFPQVQMEQGVTLDDKKLTDLKAHFYKLGLNKSQAKGIVEYYFGTINDEAKKHRTGMQASNETAIAGLKTEWGEKFDANVDMAKATLRKFGDESVLQHLESSGLGNHAPLIKMLAKIGGMVAEDVSKGGGADFNIANTTRAANEITNLKTDKDFQDALTKSNNPGHQTAVERWMRLHSIAYPGKLES